MTNKPAVAFLCVHNAGRSQIAAAWMQNLAQGRVDVYSGGSDPAAEVNPVAVDVMREVGINIADSSPHKWTIDILEKADAIVTMGCGDECPYIPGKKYEDWTVDDPAGQPIEVVRKIRDEIRTRVENLLIQLT